MQSLSDKQIKIEHIRSILINLYINPRMIYINTVLMQSVKMFPHTLNIEVSHHHHPVNTIAELPYAIINDEFVLTKDRLFQLVLTLFLVYDDRHQKHQQRGQHNQHQQHNQHNQHHYMQMNPVQISHKVMKELLPITNIAEQLAQLSVVYCDEDINPYYVFLSPVHKYEAYRYNKLKKQKLLKCGNLIGNDDQKNEEGVLKRLNEIRKLYEEEGEIYVKRYRRIVVIGLLKHLQTNCKTLYRVAVVDPVLKEAEEGRVKFLLELEEIGQKVANYPTFYTKINLKDKEDQKANVEGRMESMMKNLLLPTVVLMMFVAFSKILPNR